MERTTRVLFFVLCGVIVCGTYCFVGTVFWPLYFPALRLHLGLGLGLIVATIPALAWHIRQTNTRLVPSLVMPGAVMIALGVAAPGRPEYPAFGPIGWGLITSGIHLILIAACARLFAAPKRPPVRTSISGVALTMVLLWALHVGILGWQIRGDERWGPMLAHSVLGIFCAVLVFPHLLWFRRLVRRKAGIPVVVVILSALALWWKVTYPHDLILADFRSPLTFRDEIALTPMLIGPGERTFGTTTADRRDRELREEAGPRMDPELVGGSDGCGAAGCHEVLHQQWAGSAHRFAADNLFYRKVVEKFVQERGVDEAAFCANCHDPVRVLTGTVREAYADGLPPPGEGVGCVSCHAMVRVQKPPQNGLFTLRQPRRYPGRTVQARNRNIRLDPRAHRQDLVSNFRLVETGDTCITCHRLVVGPDIGAAQTFVLQASAQPPWRAGAELTCGDCHMPTLTIPRSFEQAIYDHHLSGVNLDLALYAWGPDIDAEALAVVRRNTEAFLGGTMDVTGLEQEVRQYEIPIQTAAVLREGGAVALTVRAERTATGLRVVTDTHNHRAGHPFPIGPFDLHEHWQEVVVTDADGAVLFHRGGLGEDLRVDPDAHRLGAVELDRSGKPLEHHRIWDLAGLEAERQIPRGGTVEDVYDIPLPPDATGPLTVHAAWRFRRANQDFVDWVFDGDGTTFPVHEMAAAEIVVP
jgi:hypothetical protein